MSTDLYLALNDPSTSIDEQEYIAWYDRHIREVLEVPGFRAARRYRLALRRGEVFPSRFRFAAIYEVDQPIEALRSALAATAGDRGHPAWWGSVGRSSLICASLDGGPAPTQPEQLYVTFTTPPVGVSFDAYDQWYGAHSRQNVTAASGLLGEVWRYRPASTAPTDEEVPEHLALYSLMGTVDDMLTQTRAAQAAGRVSSIEGYHPVASFVASALGERVVAER